MRARGIHLVAEAAFWAVGILMLSGIAPSGLACGVLVLAALVRTAVVLSLLTRRFAAVTVRGRSMEPTFREGERVLVRRDKLPRPGDVVIVRHPPIDQGGSSTPSWIIKRVAAIPGQAVPLSTVPAGTRVPAGRLVLLGDNRSASNDSRHVGYYRIDHLLGTVVRRLGTVGGSDDRRWDFVSLGQ